MQRINQTVDFEKEEFLLTIFQLLVEEGLISKQEQFQAWNEIEGGKKK